MIASNEKSPVPPELADWAREVKAQNLCVESAMVAVVSLTYKLSEHKDPAGIAPNDRQGMKDWMANRRKVRQSLNRALRALKGALQQEYSLRPPRQTMQWSSRKGQKF